MAKLTLTEHIRRSRQAVEANKAKGNRHAELFSTMYSCPHRFIEEIIQNTEDAYFRKQQRRRQKNQSLRFKLFHDRLEIHHNGKDFDEEDLMAITTFACTTKKNQQDINLIGKFGIGFKSVFTITDHPAIHSASYNYKISDYEVLDEIHPQKADEGFGTLIILPFKKKSIQNCFEIVKRGLDNLNGFYLLFLNHIDLIEIFENDKYTKSIEKQTLIKKDFSEIKILYKHHDDFNTESFIVFHSKSTKEKISIAFKTSQEKIVSITPSPVFVFFPLPVITGLNFLLHANFTTNPLREIIPFDENKAPENLLILQKATTFFLKTIRILKNNGMLDLNLISVLPIIKPTTKDNIIYNTFFNTFKDFILKEKAIPAEEKGYCFAKDAALAEDIEIYHLLNKNDLYTLFQKRRFVNKAILQKNHSVLYEYFVNLLEIKTIHAENLAFRIMLNSSFLQNKNTNWLIRFYLYLQKNHRLWDKYHSSSYYSLRYYPFILTQDNSWVAPYHKDEKPAVFLPANTKNSRLPLVNRKFTKNKDCLKFFLDLELYTPNPESIIKDGLLPNFEKIYIQNKKKYELEISNLLKYYCSFSEEKKWWLHLLLKEHEWLPASTFHGKKSLKKTSDVYIENKFLRIYFENNDNIFFIETDFFNNMFRKFGHGFVDLLYGTGIKTYPILQINEINNKTIEGFEKFLEKINIIRSKALAEIILQQKENMTSEYAEFLRNKPWIYTSENTLEAPEYISYKDFSEDYKFTEEQKKLLLTILGVNISDKKRNFIFSDWQPDVKPDIITRLEVQNIKNTENKNSFKPLTVKRFPQFMNINTDKEDEYVYSENALEKIMQWSCEFVKYQFMSMYPECDIQFSDVSDIIVSNCSGNTRYFFVCGKTPLQSKYFMKREKVYNLFRLFFSLKSVGIVLVNNVGKNDAKLKIIEEIQQKHLEEITRTLRGYTWFENL